MKILIHTQYFPPEIGAPQNRLFELAVRLQKVGAQVDVLTAMPNYPAMVIHESYRGKWFLKEELQGITVFRSWIYVAGSKRILQRLMNYFSFVFTSLIYGSLKLKKYDVVLCESPPLFLGISAWLLSKFKRAKFIFNVSDLWPESAEKLGLVSNRFFLGMAQRLEEFLYRNSTIVTGQTQGIVSNIQGRFPTKKVYWLPNGVDLSFYNPDRVTSTWREDNGFTTNQFIFLYAGIIGHAQGLEVIIEAANRLKGEDEIQFVLVGEGPEKERLMAMKEHYGLDHVHFFPAVPKEQMPSVVQASTMSIVPLKKLALFEGAIPSKIFENLAMKKPVLLGVNGEARQLFIEEGKCGLHFEPENAIDLANAILLVKDKKVDLDRMKENARAYIKRKFDREKIASEFWNYLNQTL
jgi:glycosyltransferase involved in cell wall biosynthesis